MTLDDLKKAYWDAANVNTGFPQYGMADHDAGIRAVVTAMKREIVSTIRDGESWPWTSCDADDFFEEILAPREGDKP